MNHGFPSGASVRLDEPLRRHSPWRTGGCCAAFIVVHRRGALMETLKRCRDLNWRVHVLGAGTRTAFRDGGLAGAVLRLGVEFSSIQVGEEDWRVGAATPMAALACRAAAEGLTGLSPWCDAPGTVGAAVLQDSAFAALVRKVIAVRRGREVSLSVAEVLARTPPPVIEVLLQVPEKSKKRGIRPRRLRWFEESDSTDVVALMKHAAVADARLRRVTLPSAAPELLVNLGHGNASDLALMEKSIIERVKRIRGVQLQPTVRWTGRP